VATIKRQTRAGHGC